MTRLLIKFVLFYIIILNATFSFAQEPNFNYEVSINGGLSSDETLPFWLVSNRYGAIPNSDFGSLNAAIFSNFKKPEKDFGIAYKVSATGYVADENALLINEMYVRLQYKNWALDLGNMYDDIKWDGLSSSNGNIVKSINSRAYPGINFRTLDYTKLPFAKSWLRFQLNLANYYLNDNRYVDNTMLHHKSFYLKFITSPKFSMTAGIDHYAQWGGTSPDMGVQPHSGKDFLRIFFAKAGGSNSLETDQLNALGNAIGHYLFQFDFTSDKTNLSFYYSHPFEDRSGADLVNWHDGLYGLYVDLKRPNSIINSLLAEFTYTKNMSGAEFPDQFDEFGKPTEGRGRDNYFNSGVYASGWTYFGRSLGSPYFTTVPVDENGITKGVILGDNRFMAFNLGVNGTVKPIHYKAMLSHITYFGWFENEYDPKPKQFSGLLELTLPQNTKNMPFAITLATSFDSGNYLPDNFGGFLTLTRRGGF